MPLKAYLGGMTSRFATAAQVLAGLVLICVLASAAYFLLASFEPQTRAALIAAIVAFGVAFTSSFVQRKRELEFKVREKKVDGYQKIFDFMLYLLRAIKTSEGLEEKTVHNHFYEINYALVMWGSAEAIAKWHEIQSSFGVGSSESPTAWMFVFRSRLAELVAIIRKDLGHSDTNLPSETLADLFFPLRDKGETIQMAIAELEAASKSTSSV